MTIHEATCPNYNNNHIQLSCDGVRENKSSNTSIDVYSWRFTNCKHIYPHRLVRPVGGYQIDHKKQLSEVIKDISNNNLRIMQFIADKLKRSCANDYMSHSSWFPCEYCFAKGIKIDVNNNTVAKKKNEQQLAIIDGNINQCESEPNAPETALKIENLLAMKNELKKSLNALKRKSHILWPASTMEAENRTRNSILNIVNEIENGQPLTIDQRKGIKGRSVLLDVPNFNFVYDSPAEYLHLVCLGVIKRLTELTFACGNKRRRITTRKLSPTSAFDKLMLDIKVVKEFSRRARKLDLSVFKGQEYRNLLIVFFPLVLECIEPDAKERSLWLLLAYMIRSSILPSNEYSEISLPLVQECCKKFYHIFEELFGAFNCTYNLHVLLSHLTEIRTHGPLTDTSAFKFESFYGELRRSYVPGTSSTLKQSMKKVFLKRSISKHLCQNNITISNYNTSMECNNLVYVYENKKYQIYLISDIEENFLSCYKVGQYPACFKETPNIDWSKVGVYRKGGVSSEIVEIEKSKIAGKVLNVGKYIITCPTNVLNEK